MVITFKGDTEMSEISEITDLLKLGAISIVLESYKNDIDRQAEEIKRLEKRIETYESIPAAIECPKCGTIIKVV